MTLLLLLVHLAVSFVAGLWAGLGGMASAGCSTDRCRDLVDLGVLVALGSAAGSFVVAVVWSLARLSRGRPAWWVPLATLGVMLALWLVGMGTAEVGSS